MNDLPRIFDRKKWEGWSKCPCPASSCQTILRKCKGGTIAVIPERGKFSGLMSNSNHFTSMRSEDDCLNWAISIANRHGGWE